MADGTSKEAGIDAKAFKAHEHRSWSDAAELFSLNLLAPLPKADLAGPGKT